MATKDEMKAQLTEMGVKVHSKDTVEQLESMLGGDRDTSQSAKKKYVPKTYIDKQDHVLIKCSVTTMDGKTSSRSVTIANPAGCILRSQVNNSDVYFTTLFGGLVAKFGAAHIKS